jgi:7-cyano-7-deazaguanine synthase
VNKPRAVVLVSGGLDSATVLAIVKSLNYAPYALSFDYGQRHRTELLAAARVAQAMGAIEHRTMRIDLAGIGGSALTDMNIAVPQSLQPGIPITYVPARNTIFLAMALGWAEVLGAADLFIGVNAVDYSGYPDCRSEFIAAFERVANLATKAGVDGTSTFKIHTPLITLSKAQIIQRGIGLGVDFSQTVSCYQADEEGQACGVCDSCRLRAQGFKAAGVADPTHYAASIST